MISFWIQLVGFFFEIDYLTLVFLRIECASTAMVIGDIIDVCFSFRINLIINNLTQIKRKRTEIEWKRGRKFKTTRKRKYTYISNQTNEEKNGKRQKTKRRILIKVCGSFFPLVVQH